MCPVCTGYPSPPFEFSQSIQYKGVIRKVFTTNDLAQIPRFLLGISAAGSPLRLRSGSHPPQLSGGNASFLVAIGTGPRLLGCHKLARSFASLRISAAGSRFAHARQTPQVVNERRLWLLRASKSVVSGDVHTSAMAHQIFIFGQRHLGVCDGGHWLDVMENRWSIKNSLHGAGLVRANEWEVLKMKVRPPARAKRSRTVPAVREATLRQAFSKSARSGAPPVVSVDV